MVEAGFLRDSRHEKRAPCTRPTAAASIGLGLVVDLTEVLFAVSSSAVAVSHEEFVRPRQDCLSRAKTEDGKDARRWSTERASSRNLTLLRSELDAHGYLPHSGATRVARRHSRTNGLQPREQV